MAEIKIYGTSHISQESIDLIEKAIEKDQPDLVAIELDQLRLNSLMSNKPAKTSNIFIKLIQMFQRHLGKKTGVMPGDEMLKAYNMSLENGIDVALIDRDIRITISKLKQVSRKEKVKAFVSLILSPITAQKIDIAQIPDDQLINQMTEQVKQRYPQIHNALIDERDQYMAKRLKELSEERPNSKITVFVGAGHKTGIKKYLQTQTQHKVVIN